MTFFIVLVSEFWLVAGGWSGKMILWTQPNENNNFTITARCRIGHQGDILTLDSAHNYIISGGVDGFCSVWNQFSGELKFSIKLPDPVNEKDH
jgi:WD40 repeat protein